MACPDVEQFYPGQGWTLGSGGIKYESMNSSPHLTKTISSLVELGYTSSPPRFHYSPATGKKRERAGRIGSPHSSSSG